MGWDPQTQKPDREEQKAEKTEKWPEEEEKVVLGRAGEKCFKKEEKISASPSAISQLGMETCPGMAQGSHCDWPEHVPRGCGTGGDRSGRSSEEAGTACRVMPGTSSGRPLP